jgi:malate dehydrogenase (oxaloacetate-decarboxylating)(NADP+)
MSQNGSVPNNDRESLRKAALEYHEFPVPGKLSVTPTKQLTNQRDLALAYSPGVAASSEEIVADPVNVFRYTARGNLVAVITDGTAVLGLGAIGPLAAKPVMEGKAVLFKEFAGIDVFDIEVDQRDPDKLIEVIAALEPTFGGINLEDIKAPECFYVERELRKPKVRCWPSVQIDTSWGLSRHLTLGGRRWSSKTCCTQPGRIESKAPR